MAGTEYRFSVSRGSYHVVDPGLGDHSVLVRSGRVVTFDFVDLCF